MALYSRAGNNPDLGNYSSSYTYSDHYFAFLFEDMTVTKVEYDTDEVKITATQPMVIGDQQTANTSSVAQQSSITLSETKTHTSTFDYTLGFTISVGTTFSGMCSFCRIPLSF
jgi:hypothetical protein